jgi:hypothetical protein
MFFKEIREYEAATDKHEIEDEWLAIRKSQTSSMVIEYYRAKKEYKDKYGREWDA